MNISREASEEKESRHSRRASLIFDTRVASDAKAMILVSKCAKARSEFVRSKERVVSDCYFTSQD